MVLAVGCSSSKKPKVAVLLPEKYNTPDGMVLGADGNIYLSCPNYNDPNYPAKIIKIGPDDQVTEVFTLTPPNAKTGVHGALGIDFGPDGHLYIADNQGIAGTKEYQSRLVRVIMKNGQAVRKEVLVTDFRESNAVSCFGDSVYVTETCLDPEAYPMPSGVYRFKVSEFKGTPIQLKHDAQDEHLVVKLYTYNKEWAVGANGLAFDAAGRMLVCNFGETSIERFTLDDQGEVTKREVVARGDGMESTDGMKICSRTGAIYVADFAGDAVHKVCPETGKVTTLWKNAVNLGGSDGLLDKPSEVCLRGNRLYIANIDLPFAGNEYDQTHTISVIKLK
jgi:sugar lactone lactonase YvrE